MSGSFARIPDLAIRRSIAHERMSGDSAPRPFVPSIGRVPPALRHSTAQAIRQSSLIQSQHSPGNASVQRMIAATIMRCGCAPGEACSCSRGGADAEREKKEGSR
jgi:hypothetical protein